MRRRRLISAAGLLRRGRGIGRVRDTRVRRRYFGMARLSAYGLAVTVVCQANAAYVKWSEAETERTENEERSEEKRVAKAERRNPKKKDS